MTERDVETIVQRGLECYPNAKSRIISANGIGTDAINPRGRTP